jgi:hypothetical protein
MVDPSKGDSFLANYKFVGSLTYFVVSTFEQTKNVP